MPEKNPQNYSLLTYLAFAALSLWGGVVAYLRALQKHDRTFRWGELFIQMAVSGFVGVLTLLLTWYFKAPLPLCGFLTGMSGFMGSEALRIYEKRYSSVMRGES